ncbi:LpqN/LpqT family lipoprotein [Mycobacterium sp. 1245801.1]|uniref:LpqN/LpqT family lipoprotein n=1 Tax=Mycobacterium sp. 1245801.1 TaxID=1834075 RepID=UPI0007FDE39E|nr:LpqN/LpqT family lipoprotein [Mycobacterium sp. 1245801.1]OBJ23749.1 hypothetical protein A5622_12790 [Mycobacterium sp. 1245801.1]
MRFDEFVARHGVALSPVDRFGGLMVEVRVPPGWEPFDSAVGLRVWACRTDPHIDVFGANAVLTMHRVEAVLDPAEVFAMLAEQQLQSVPGCHEVHREVRPAGASVGVQGLLVMLIAHELGTIDSVSRSRIIPTEKETLIAQLTVTALHDSPVERAGIGLDVHMGAAPVSPASGDHHRKAPATTTRDNG